MAAYLFLLMVKANEMCERAVRYRRSLVTDPLIDAGEVRQLIYHAIPSRDVRADADGWVHINNLVDRIAGKTARIMWEPETDRVRLVWKEARAKR